MKSCSRLISACLFSFTFTANASSVRAEHPTPEYLSVPGFEDCLKTISMGTWTSWCLPANQPEQCSNDSWVRLVELSDEGKLPVCLEMPDPVR